MKTYKITSALSAAILCLVMSSCIGNLDVKPIDPTVTLPEDVLSSKDAYVQLLAKCYQSFAVSSSYGVNGDPDIEGIDGGFGQYTRALFYMNEYTTDEATCPWNDLTIRNLHGLAWTTSDVFVTAMFSRIYYSISLCNEFIRQASDSQWAKDSDMLTYIAEARALRMLSYYHAIDMFGNVPFAREYNSVGSTGPEQISRADLMAWLLEEGQALLDEGDILSAGTNVYGRADAGLVKMIMAKLYLNCEVYDENIGNASTYYDACASICTELMGVYNLASNYAGLFGADNKKYWNQEIIFAIEADGTQIQSYGGTTFIVMSAIQGGASEWQEAMGVSDGWGGINVTSQFLDLFDESDKRFLFWGGGPDGDWPRTLVDIADFTSGWSSYKYTNLKEDGSPADGGTSFCDTDMPIFRAADANLMLAEAQLRKGALGSDGLAAWNAVRTRAGIAELSTSEATLDEMLNERGREFYWENLRRSDLIRFGKFTTNSYLWQWKGGVYDGTGVDTKFNLMPIPSNEINSNGKLTQNPGY